MSFSRLASCWRQVVGLTLQSLNLMDHKLSEIISTRIRLMQDIFYELNCLYLISPSTNHCDLIFYVRFSLVISDPRVKVSKHAGNCFVPWILTCLWYI